MQVESLNTVRLKSQENDTKWSVKSFHFATFENIKRLQV